MNFMSFDKEGNNFAKYFRKNCSGLTLLEVVIAVSLLATLSTFSLLVVSNLLRNSVKSQAVIDVEQTSNFVVLKIRNDLGKAVNVRVDDSRTLSIYQGPKLGSVVYKILPSNNCASQTVAGCIKRNSTFLTDSTTSSSAVSVEPSSSFSQVVDSKGNVVAVNLNILFKKPTIAGTTKANFNAQSIVKTTIAVAGP